MDGLVEELLRLEDAKHKALIEFNASAYEKDVREQLRLLAESGPLSPQTLNRPDRVIALAQLITLNSRLLSNLASISPAFQFAPGAYTSQGNVAPAALRRFSAEV